MTLRSEPRAAGLQSSLGLWKPLPCLTLQALNPRAAQGRVRLLWLAKLISLGHLFLLPNRQTDQPMAGAQGTEG